MTPYYITCLKSELEKRKRKNERYSLRAFAGKLHLDPSFLSRILLRKQPLSPSAAQKICQTLELSAEQKRLFLSSVATEKRNAIESKMAKSLSVPDLRPPVFEVNQAKFGAMGNMHDYAILECTTLDNYSGRVEWIAEYLNLPLEQVAESVERMKSAGLIGEDNGVLKKVHAKVWTTFRSETADKMRNYQKEVFAQAADAIDRTPHDKCPTTTMVVAVDPDKVVLAQKMLTDFALELCDFLESGKKTELYQTAISLYPVTSGLSQSV